MLLGSVQEQAVCQVQADYSITEDLIDLWAVVGTAQSALAGVTQGTITKLPISLGDKD